MYPIEEYFNRLRTASCSLSPNGKQLAYISWTTGSPQVWLADVPASGLLPYPKPLTSDTKERPYTMGASLCWAGESTLLCRMDSEGDEQTYIRIFDLKLGTSKIIERIAGARDLIGHCSLDGKTFFFSSNRGNPAAQGLYTYSLVSGEIKPWYQHSQESAEWIPYLKYKGRWLFTRAQGNGANSLHAIDPKTKKVFDLFTDKDCEIWPVDVRGNQALVIANRSRQFMDLAYLDLKTGKLKYLASQRWEVEIAKLSHDKKLLIASRNVAGRSELEIYRYPSLKKVPLRTLKNGTIGAFNVSRRSPFAVVTYMSPTEQNNFYRLDLKTFSISPLTDNWVSKVPKNTLSAPKLVSYPSQGQKIYSWLYLPKQRSKKGAPVVIWPHGGPQHQERATFSPFFQYLVARGFAVWAPNHTGSTGFGKDFCFAIRRQWGTADLPDMKNGIAWLKASGFIDPDRIAIAGGSYGGYMTLRSITRIPNTFKAAVDIFGVSNLFTFINSVPPDWIPYVDELVGSAERDEAMLREQSPIFELENVDCPLLVIQGAKDPRVVKAESDQLVKRLGELKKPVEYLVFEDEGHGFNKRENELKAYATAADFLEKHLGGHK